MILCLVTDRRRLGTMLGLPEAGWAEALRQQVIGAAAGGVDFIQVREPDLEAAELAALVRSLMAASSSSQARILVNDRIDVALATGASGVHSLPKSLQSVGAHLPAMMSPQTHCAASSWGA